MISLMVLKQEEVVDEFVKQLLQRWAIQSTKGAERHSAARLCSLTHARFSLPPLSFYHNCSQRHCTESFLIPIGCGNAQERGPSKSESSQGKDKAQQASGKQISWMVLLGSYFTSRFLYTSNQLLLPTEPSLHSALTTRPPLALRPSPVMLTLDFWVPLIFWRRTRRMRQWRKKCVSTLNQWSLLSLVMILAPLTSIQRY